MSIDRYTDEAIKLAQAATDAFGRQRVSDPVTLFDSQNQYENNQLVWQDVKFGDGTASFSAATAAVELRTGTTSGDRVIRQTRQYHRYQPGKSQLVLMTYVFSNPARENVSQKVGYFDNDNGIYLDLSGTTLQLVWRTKTTGTVQNNAIAQADWNLDKMADLDVSKAQIFFIDLEWLGVGSVRCGFVIDGIMRPAHQFKNANVLATVYMTTANLPVRYEIHNTGLAGGANSMQALCCTVMSEGGFESDRGIPFSASNGINDVTIPGTRKPVLSIRPALTYNSITNRGQLQVSGIEVYSRANPAFVEVIYNPTLTSASWGSVSSYSMAQKDTDATSVSGGIVVASFYVAAAGSANPTAPSNPAAASRGLLSRFPVTIDYSAEASTVLTVAATCFSATASVSVSINWQELK